MRRQMTERPIQNRVFGQFCSILRKDIIANYKSIWTQFSTSVTRIDVLCNALNDSWLCRYLCRYGDLRLPGVMERRNGPLGLRNDDDDSGVYPYLQMAQLSHGHFFIGGGTKKH